MNEVTISNFKKKKKKKEKNRNRKLGTTTSIHYHTRKQSVNNVRILVKIEHGYRRQFAWCAARAATRRVREVDDVSVGMLLQKDVRALSRTVIGFISLRGDYPIPAKLLKVHRQRVAATTPFFRVFWAIETDGPLGPLLLGIGNMQLEEGHLWAEITILYLT